MPDALKIERFPEHPIWGDCVFLTAQTEDAEVVRSAYAEQSEAWPPLHFAISGPTAEELDPWCRLGFAQMHAYGVRASGAEPFDAPGVALRRGAADDLETAIRLDLLIEQAQAEPPSYSSYVRDEAEHRDAWIETLADEAVTYVVAERDGVAVGHATLPPDPVDDQALHIASTAVVPEARGTGVGRALTTFALRHAAERRLPRVRTNWRVTNLLASRYWPARGFELTHIRLFRRLPDL
jgi:ribosomal protein S18 acetylase RimI-like enzyme